MALLRCCTSVQFLRRRHSFSKFSKSSSIPASFSSFSVATTSSSSLSFVSVASSLDPSPGMQAAYVPLLAFVRTRSVLPTVVVAFRVLQSAVQTRSGRSDRQLAFCAGHKISNCSCHKCAWCRARILSRQLPIPQSNYGGCGQPSEATTDPVRCGKLGGASMLQLGNIYGVAGAFKEVARFSACWSAFAISSTFLLLPDECANLASSRDRL